VAVWVESGQHTCDGFGGQKSILELFGPPIGGVVFPYGFYESLFLSAQVCAVCSNHFGVSISMKFSLNNKLSACWES
jgi:hypothetical protein